MAGHTFRVVESRSGMLLAMWSEHRRHHRATGDRPKLTETRIIFVAHEMWVQHSVVSRSSCLFASSPCWLQVLFFEPSRFGSRGTRTKLKHIMFLGYQSLQHSSSRFPAIFPVKLESGQVRSGTVPSRLKVGRPVAAERLLRPLWGVRIMLRGLHRPARD